MLKEKKIITSHKAEVLREYLADPSFVFPRLFPPIKKVSRDKETFTAEGKFMGMPFEIKGDSRKEFDKLTYFNDKLDYYDEIFYSFTLKAGKKLGRGQLKILIVNNTVNLTFEYYGWMDTFSNLFFMERWFENFAEKLNEEIRVIEDQREN